MSTVKTLLAVKMVAAVFMLGFSVTGFTQNGTSQRADDRGQGGEYSEQAADRERENSDGVYRMSEQSRNSDQNWKKDHKGAYQNSTGHNSEQAGSRQSDDSWNKKEKSGTGPAASDNPE